MFMQTKKKHFIAKVYLNLHTTEYAGYCSAVKVLDV